MNKTFLMSIFFNEANYVVPRMNRFNKLHEYFCGVT